MKIIKRILIANRGEIAVRIIRTAHQMGIQTIAVYTEADRCSLAVSLAGEAVLLPGDTLAETYLNQSLLIRIALDRKVDAVHPGYGFLAENAAFADAVEQAGLVFVGPASEQIRLMGEKHKAVELARQLGIPVLNSISGTKKELAATASSLGFPLLIKAVAGGGGKGMQVVLAEEELSAALDKAERQAIDYFGNGELLVEQYIPEARHVEVQLLGDRQGHILHLFERECSIQRRFQKIEEEAPSAFVGEVLRQQLAAAALKIGKAIHYRSLGTVEFLVDNQQNYWFLEMNTRIQVEHPVTEQVTGIDLVEQQLLVADGGELAIAQEDLRLRGHAIEARICAEDAGQDFRPSTGVIDQWFFPEGEGLRTDHFLEHDTRVSPFYDSLLAKQIAWGNTRQEAIERLRAGLLCTWVNGVKTNLSFLLSLLDDRNFTANKLSTSFLNDFVGEEHPVSLPVAAAYWFHYVNETRNQTTGFGSIPGAGQPAMPWRIWLDNREQELMMECLPGAIRLSSNGQTASYELRETESDRLVLNSDQQQLVFFLQDKKEETRVFFRGQGYAVRSTLRAEHIRLEKKVSKAGRSFQPQVFADLFGKVLSVGCLPGDEKQEGDLLLVMESMKTEFRILCPQQSIVKRVCVTAGEMIKDGQLLVELEEKELQD